jgi:MraZ protein
VELDKQGRVLIPQGIRTSTGLDGRAVFVGCGDHLELWNQGKWAEEQAALAAAEAEELRR